MRRWYSFSADGMVQYIGRHMSYSDAEDANPYGDTVWLFDHDALEAFVNHALVAMEQK